MSQVNKKLTDTILSMSLLTVMAGAAIAPALGVIKEHFSTSSALLVQFIVSIPALLIIITNLFFLNISRHFGTRQIALAGLMLYVLAGAGCFLADDIYVLLTLRALLGVSVGLVMPLSTGLLAYYYPPEQQAHLMGLSAAMNQMGGVVATLLAGLLAGIGWQWAFLVYLLGVFAIVMVVRYLPDEHLGSANKRGIPFQPRQLLKFHPSVNGMLLLMMIFFIYPTNFAITAHEQMGLGLHTTTLIMVGLDLIAFFAGLVFGQLMQIFRTPIKYFAPLFFLAGYLCFALAHGILLLLVGAVFTGVANGVGVPYLNTIASIKGGRNSATTVMPLLSASLYLGQFLSPVIVTPLAKIVFGDSDVAGAYKIGIVLCVIFLIQVYTTRHYQSLPPEE
ncbi:MAG: MFS transporter [Prevotella sp.]|nr:MFS transporter [Prevotella sp.]